MTQTDLEFVRKWFDVPTIDKLSLKELKRHMNSLTKTFANYRRTQSTRLKCSELSLHPADGYTKRQFIREQRLFSFLSATVNSLKSSGADCYSAINDVKYADKLLPSLYYDFTPKIRYAAYLIHPFTKERVYDHKTYSNYAAALKRRELLFKKIIDEY